MGREKAWIRGDENTITLVDIHGSVQNGIVVCDSWAPDISVTEHGKLAFSDRGTVNLFRRSRIETSLLHQKVGNREEYAAPNQGTCW